MTLPVRILLGCAGLLAVAQVFAQGGPPYLTNDPGTPGNAHWEINLASMQTVAKGAASYQTPQIDLNFGLGERVQLTYEIPYVISSLGGGPTGGGATTGGWGNAYPGIKWRFLDQGDQGWQVSTFPQVETGVASRDRLAGIGSAGPRYFLPVEASKVFGPVAVDVEAGYYVAGHGPRERILGLVLGHEFTDRLEFDAEIYDDHPYDATPHTTTLDAGGRYKLSHSLIALFMVGRSVSGVSAGQPEYMGYFGIQILTAP